MVAAKFIVTICGLLRLHRSIFVETQVWGGVALEALLLPDKEIGLYRECSVNQSSVMWSEVKACCRGSCSYLEIFVAAVV